MKEAREDEYSFSMASSYAQRRLCTSIFLLELPHRQDGFKKSSPPTAAGVICKLPPETSRVLFSSNSPLRRAHGALLSRNNRAAAAFDSVMMSLSPATYTAAVESAQVLTFSRLEVCCSTKLE